MKDNFIGGESFAGENKKEAVCINAPRIYDSCSDKDCLEDLPLLLTKPGQCIADKAASVRISSVNVCSVSVDLQPVPFHKGYYSVDMTFYFDVCLDAFMAPNAMPMPVKGLAVFSKRAVLYGSEGSVKVFTSDCCDSKPAEVSENCPKAIVQVAQPVALSARIAERQGCCPMPPCRIPEEIMRRYGGEFVRAEAERDILVSIGIFTVVQLERSVQMLIPAIDYCIPKKECVASAEDPCELFSAIEFPTSEFFPADRPDENGCGCGCRQ